MACNFNLFDVLQDETGGGTFVFDFYSTTQDATEDTGGSAVDIGADGSIDTNGWIAGFYYFTYTVGEGDCETSVQFVIQIVDRPDAGIGATVDLCTNDDAVNIFSLITGTPQLTGVWSGSGFGTDGHVDPDSSDPLDDMFDPQLSGVGVFSFIYTVDVENQDGWTLSNCENCLPVFTVVTFNVTSCVEECNLGESNFIQVCRQQACQFNLIEQLDGTPDDGGGWVLLAGAPQVIVITGGHLGTVNFINAQVGTYNFEYTIPDCSGSSIVTVQVVNEPFAGNNMNLTLCETMPNTNLYNLLTGQKTSGGVWEISPQLPFGTFTSNGFIDPAEGDAGTYNVTYTVTVPTNENPCGTVCQDISNHVINIFAGCEAGTSPSGDTICKTDSITLDASVLTGGDGGGTWFVFGQSIPCNNSFGQAIFRVNGGSQSNHQFQNLNDGDVLSDFLNTGCIAFIYTCTGDHSLCTDTASYMLTIINCGASCNAVWTITPTACLMTSSHTGLCTNPIYQWQRDLLLNGNWTDVAGATGANYTGVDGGRYRLKITNCENCGTLYSNQLTLSCPPPPSCTISCVLTYNATLQRLQAVITNTGSASCSVPYQFNRATTNNANCILCTGWQAATCSGNVVVPALGSVQVNCNVLQQSAEQCFRFVTLVSCCNQTQCCVKIPAIATQNYQIVNMPPNTEIIGVTVNTGSGNVVWNKVNQPTYFNCTEYESRFPLGLMDGNINCSLAQLVNDINQRLAAGFSGDAFMIQSSKSSSIKIENTNVVFVNVIQNVGAPIPFTTMAATGCDVVNSWHFQQVDSEINFNVQLYSGSAGTFNIFTEMMQKFMPEIPNTGTFTKATGTTQLAGCIEIVTDCLAVVGSTITITNGGGNHGLLSWSAFTQLTIPECSFQLRYLFQMPDTGCNECMYINITFINNLP